MKRTCALVLMILMYAPLVLSSPAYATSHSKDDTVSTPVEADDEKKKEGAEEEPDCD